MEGTVETIEEKVNKGSWKDKFINIKTGICLAFFTTAFTAGVLLEGDYIITSRSLKNVERIDGIEKSCEMAQSYQNKEDNPFFRMITAGGRDAAKDYLYGRCE